ncbi:MAG: tetratricopeptide repeat protein [Bacteroidetes bacterium]|nr:tetratricopeptide repeat protein [Bacteroidota bacterium]
MHRTVLLYFLILLAVMTAGEGFATGNITDSLEHKLALTGKDTTRVKILIELCSEYAHINAETAINYGLQAVQTAKEIDYKKGIAAAGLNLGLAYDNQGGYSEAMKYEKYALELFLELENPEYIGLAYSNIGSIQSHTGKFREAIESLRESLNWFEKIGHKKWKAKALNDIGIAYDYMGDYENAVTCYMEALRLYEDLYNLQGTASTLNNIGEIMRLQDRYEEALEYYEKAGALYDSLQDRKGEAMILNNCAITYYCLDQKEKSRNSFLKTYEIYREVDDKFGMTRTLHNLGELEALNGNYPVALEYYFQSLKITEQLGNTEQIARTLSAIGKNYTSMKEFKKAIEYIEKANELAMEINAKPVLLIGYQSLAEVYYEMGDYKTAIDWYVKYYATKDSIFNENSQKQISELKTQYETEKKEQELELKNLQLTKQEEVNSRQRILIYTFVIAFVIILALAVFLFRIYRQKRKANRLLAEQNMEIMQKNEEITAQRDAIAEQNEQILQQKEEIEAQRDEIKAQMDIVEDQKDRIETINHELTDSIHYAKRIQRAILPAEALFEKAGFDYFIVYKPRDIVSGDFYWMTLVEGRIVIAVADCTGHGVPGAFMSMLGAAFLNEIVTKEYITHTGVILRKLRKEIVRALQQKGVGEERTEGAGSDNVKDGMDIAICSINMEKRELQYSGANNPLYIIRGAGMAAVYNATAFPGETDVLYELKGDKMPIAIYERMDKFTDHEIKLTEGDQLYMFSDGLPDQFGGTKGKKFKYKPLKQLLLSGCHKKMQEQEILFNTMITDWMAHIDPVSGERFEQVDDITVLGIRIK